MSQPVRITIPYGRSFAHDAERIYSILFEEFDGWRTTPSGHFVCRYSGRTLFEIHSAAVLSRAFATGDTSSFDLSLPSYAKAIEFKLTHETDDLRIEIIALTPETE